MTPTTLDLGPKSKIHSDAGQGLPRRDWAGVLPTQTFLNSNVQNFFEPDNLSQNG